VCVYIYVYIYIYIYTHTHLFFAQVARWAGGAAEGAAGCGVPSAAAVCASHEEVVARRLSSKLAMVLQRLPLRSFRPLHSDAAPGGYGGYGGGGGGSGGGAGYSGYGSGGVEYNGGNYGGGDGSLVTAGATNICVQLLVWRSRG